MFVSNRYWMDVVMLGGLTLGRVFFASEALQAW